MGELERPDTLNNNTGNRDTNGKTVRSRAINPAIRTLVLITAGQSNMMNILPTSTVPVNGSALDNFNIYDGQMYAAQDPLLGTTTAAQGGSFGVGCVASRIGDQLITNGKFDRVILVPITVGGTGITAWSEGAPLNNRIIAAMNRLAYAGITPSTPGVTFAAIWAHGESDNVNLTPQATYAASLLSWIATARAAGMSGRIFVNLETWYNGPSAAIRAAQASVIGGNVFYGADMDSLDNTYRFGDFVHLTDAGAVAYKNLIIAAMASSGAPF